ncbi:hypothetical protein [Streptomyces griseus]|uniref:hypothetical protein n=1 Tax=Streptomyces griseus TaxID=1911 RepID=UPI00056807D6|nr:hypothetical protein [Streptomyces griseus]
MTVPHQRAAHSGGDLRLLRAAMFAAVCVVLAAAGHTLASCATVPLWTLGAGFLGVLVVVAPFAGRERSLAGIAALLAAGQTVLHTLFGLGQHAVGTAAMSASSASAASTSTSSMPAMSSMSDAEMVARAARLVCGTTAAAISPARAHKILVDARIYDSMDMSAAHHPADALATAGSSESLLPSLPMLLAHLLAALAVGWLLRRGDMALLRLLDLSAQDVAKGVAEGALVRSLRGALALVRALLAGLPAAPEAGPRVPRTALLGTPSAPPTDAIQHTVIRRGPPRAALSLAA